MDKDNQIRVEKFTGESYHLWKFKMEMLLKAREVWEVVEVNMDVKEMDAIERKAWKRKDEKALALICLTLSDGQLMHVHGASTAHAAWKKLKEVHERTGVASRLYLRRKFLTLRMEEGADIQKHINKIRELAQKLIAVGEKLGEEDLVSTLLYSLPESYETLVVSLESKEEILSMEDLTARLLHEEQRRKEAGKASDAMEKSEKAFLSTGKHLGERKPKNKDRKCFYCGKTGHLKKNCWKQASEKARKADGRENGSKAATQEFALMGSHHRKEDPDSATWVLDSGASLHMSYRKDWMSSYSEISPLDIHLADERTVQAVGKGNIALKVHWNGSSRMCHFLEVLHVPDLERNLFSVSKAVKQGARVEFRADECWVKMSEGQVALKGEHQDGLYLIKGEVVHQIHAKSAWTTGKASFDVWHQRYGHLNDQSIKALHKGLVKGLDISGSMDKSFCEGCALGKHSKRPFASGEATRASELLELIHSDVCGPMQTSSLGGCKYFVTFIDDMSRSCFVYLMKQKLEVLSKFKEFEAWATNFTGRKIKTLRSDNGGEYLSKQFDEYLASKGIQRQLRAPYTPEQNGVAERMNRTLLESARCMLKHAGLQNNLWGEALATAVYLRNRSPSRAISATSTPYEVWTGEKPDVGHLRTFGSRGYVHVPAEKRQKLDQKSVKCMLVGYSTQSKAWRLLQPETKQILVSRDVLFNEEELGSTSKCQEVKEDDVLLPLNAQEDDPTAEESVNEEAQEDAARSQDESRLSDSTDELFEDAFAEEGDISDEEHTTGDVQPRRSTRIIQKPREWWRLYGQLAALAAEIQPEEPKNIKEALSSSAGSQWELAAKAEFESLMENETWELVKLPPGRKPIGCKWVFKLKMNPDGTVDRYKARLVAKGYSQVEGVDYSETFAPVAKFPSIRAILALAASEDMEIHQMDVKTAFLNGTLDEEIYMDQPEGFRVPGKEGLVCKLKKSLYGLKQAPRAWNVAIHAYLRCLGMQQSNVDHCVYIKKWNNHTLWMVIYVDDLILASDSMQLLEEVKRALKSGFKMTDLGELKHFLGIQVAREREKRKIWLSQQHYITQILRKYGMQDCKSVKTPLDTSQKLQKTMQPKNEEEKQQMSAIPYRQAVGSLIYAMQGTRPDIAAAIGSVSQYMENPGMQHWTAVKRILRYLQGTRDLALWIGGEKPLGYSDADWAGCLDTRRSTTGALWLIGGAVSWQSKKQATTALSSTEAEYMALTAAAKDGIWLRALLQSLGRPVESPLVILEDNQGAIALAKNPVSHARSKHIDVRYHFIREALERGEIKLEYCSTADMAADVLTKALSAQKVMEFREKMGLARCQMFH